MLKSFRTSIMNEKLETPHTLAGTYKVTKNFVRQLCNRTYAIACSTKHHQYYLQYYSSLYCFALALGSAQCDCFSLSSSALCDHLAIISATIAHTSLGAVLLRLFMGCSMQSLSIGTPWPVGRACCIRAITIASDTAPARDPLHAKLLSQG